MHETWYGEVKTPADAIKLFEACRLGLLPRVQRRLSEKERHSIRPGSVFVWDERESGMRRWTDGKAWSASRVSGSFLTYREMEGKRSAGFGTSNGGGKRSAHSPETSTGNKTGDDEDGEQVGYRYKPNGLLKQSFSITTSNQNNLHLISYSARAVPGEPELRTPSADPALATVHPPKGLYPDSGLGNSPKGPAFASVPIQVGAYPAPYRHRLHQSQQQQQRHMHHHRTTYSGPPGHAGALSPGSVKNEYPWLPSPLASPPFSQPRPARLSQAAPHSPGRQQRKDLAYSPEHSPYAVRSALPPLAPGSSQSSLPSLYSSPHHQTDRLPQLPEIQHSHARPHSVQDSSYVLAERATHIMNRTPPHTHAESRPAGATLPRIFTASGAGPSTPVSATSRWDIFSPKPQLTSAATAALQLASRPQSPPPSAHLDLAPLLGRSPASASVLLRPDYPPMQARHDHHTTSSPTDGAGRPELLARQLGGGTVSAEDRRAIHALNRSVLL